MTVRELIISSLVNELGGIRVADGLQQMSVPLHIGVVLDVLQLTGWSVEIVGTFEAVVRRVYDGQLAEARVSGDSGAEPCSCHGFMASCLDSTAFNPVTDV